MIDKQHILDEIRRTAKENGGEPLGQERFRTETGIKVYDWCGRHWRKWSEALIEAGYTPNRMNTAYDDIYLIETMIAFIREIKRYPVSADIRMRARSTQSFPSHNAFGRLGSKSEFAQKIITYCREKEGYEDVIDICEPIARNNNSTTDESKEVSAEPQMGFVYLMKSGKFHKIGRTNSVGRREYELSIQLPEELITVHKIKTDDPAGIEEYWHKRFADQRANGEWFKLSASDITAYKRRTFM